MYFHNETHGVMQIKQSAMTRFSCQNLVCFAFFEKEGVFVSRLYKTWCNDNRKQTV